MSEVAAAGWRSSSSLGALCSSAAPRAAGAPVVGKLTWYGQSCFLLETAAGTRVAHGPVRKDGRPGAAGRAARRRWSPSATSTPTTTTPQMSTGAPHVIRGLTADKKGWARIDEKVPRRLDPLGRRLPRRQAGHRAGPRHRLHLRGRRPAHRAPRRSRPHARRRPAGGDRLGRRAAGARGRRHHARRLPGDARRRPAPPAPDDHPHALHARERSISFLERKANVRRAESPTVHAHIREGAPRDRDCPGLPAAPR